MERRFSRHRLHTPNSTQENQSYQTLKRFCSQVSKAQDLERLGKALDPRSKGWAAKTDIADELAHVMQVVMSPLPENPEFVSERGNILNRDP